MLEKVSLKLVSEYCFLKCCMPEVVNKVVLSGLKQELFIWKGILKSLEWFL